MDWKEQFKVRNLSFRDTCIVFLLIAVNLFFLFQIDFNRVNPDAVHCAICTSQQWHICKIMRDVPAGEDFELPPEWTVADLIQEAVRKDSKLSGPVWEKEFFCRSKRYKHAFLRCKPREVIQSYLVFPQPASVVFDKSLHPAVPILMCPPDADRAISFVLYSDGSQKKMAREEAEQLVAAQSPVPLKLDFETQPEEEQKP